MDINNILSDKSLKTDNENVEISNLGLGPLKEFTVLNTFYTDLKAMMPVPESLRGNIEVTLTVYDDGTNITLRGLKILPR